MRSRNILNHNIYMYKLVNHCLILIFNIFSMMLSFDSVAVTHIVFVSQNIILAENVRKDFHIKHKSGSITRFLLPVFRSRGAAKSF